MKKVTLLNIALVCFTFIGFGVLTAFDGSETDEQKVEKAYQVLVDVYNAEQDSLCKLDAMTAAKASLDTEMAATPRATGEEEQPAPEPTSEPSTVGGGETQSPPPPPPPAPEPEPTPAPEPPKTGKSGKMSGQKSSTASSKAGKMGGSSKSSGGTSSADKKKSKMGGGK